jgi:hypothetical protein
MEKIWGKSTLLSLNAFAHYCLIKTLHEKLQENSSMKKSTTYVFGTNCDLLDHIILNSLWWKANILGKFSPWTLQNCPAMQRTFQEAYAHRDLISISHTLQGSYRNLNLILLLELVREKYKVYINNKLTFINGVTIESSTEVRKSPLE